MKKIYLFFFLTLPAFVVAQTQYQGKVVDSSTGAPLASVSIVLLSSGSAKGTMTDSSGNFTLAASSGQQISISSVGYDFKTVTLADSSNLLIKLLSRSASLNDVVVVGYGTQRKIDVTGSVAEIKGGDIAKQASVNPVSGLQGKVAGVQITNTGAPGSSPDIKIRGLGTYSSNSAPLYIVDGVWVSDLNFLNPADIENVSILKDASSEAIYGVRGANGVVIVTTKKGAAKGDVSVNYNGYIGFQAATHIPKMASAHEYAILYNELQRANASPGSTPNLLDSSKFGKGTNWFDEELQHGIITNHQVSVNGGSEKNSYNLSLGYLDQDGILKTNTYKRYTASFKNDIQISKYIKAGYTVIGTYGRLHDVPGGIWRQLYTAPGVLPVRESDGSYGDPATYGLGAQISNPQVTLDYNYGKTENYHLNGNAYVDITFAKHFTFHSSIGGIYDQNQAKTFIPKYKANTNQQSQNNILTIVDYSTRNWITENTLTYSNTFGASRLTAMIGQTAYRNQYGETHTTAQNGSLTTDAKTWFVGNADPSTVQSYDITPSAMGVQTYPTLEKVSSYFGRVTYAYKDRYTFTGTLRSDASSKFTSDYGRAVLPSVGAAWIVSNEDFMKRQKLFDVLKLKASWGKVGNSGIPAYIGTQATFIGNGVQFGNGNILTGQSVASPVPPPLTWEKGEGTDVGLEATVLNDRFDVNADYYNKKTTGFVFPVLYAGSNGYTISSLAQNVGDLSNNGFEISLNWHDKIGQDFSYNIGGNLAYNKNKFTKNIFGGQKLYSGGTASNVGQLGTLTTQGVPVGVYYGYKVTGIFQTQQEIDNYTDADGNKYEPDAKPGDFKYESITGKGPISGNDRVVLGNPNPKYVYGINTSFSYKSFDLEIDFNGVAGVQLYNANKGLRFGNENFTQDFYDHRWHGEGTSNTDPSVNLGGGLNNSINSWYIESGSYFRIRNIQLGYTLSDDITKRWGLKGLRFYVNAQNPFTFTKYTGFSPEVGGAPGSIGIDNNIYPIYAIYNFGLNVTL